MTSAAIHRWNKRKLFVIYKISPFILIYFFLNNFALPQGLLYTTLFAPIFYVWLLTKREHNVLLKYLAISIPFVVAQFCNVKNLNLYFYFRSFILFMLIYITIYAASVALKHICNPKKIFEKIIVYNFFLACGSLLLLGTSYQYLTWQRIHITAGSGVIPRLKLLCYEPSAYSRIIVPFAVFAFNCYVFDKGIKRFFIVLLVVFPLGLSFSMGVISALIMAIGVVCLLKSKQFFGRPIVLFSAIVIAGAGLVILQTDNLISLRIHNIITGSDTSGNARIWQSFNVASEIAKSTSLWWGAGFGQSKLLAAKFFDVYWPGLNVIRITNVVASTFAEFGIMGLLLRFGLEFYLFFKTRVYASNFRLILYLFAFIYQFTGSYLTDLAAYIIWVFAFIPVFMEWEKQISPITFRCRRQGRIISR